MNFLIKKKNAFKKEIDCKTVIKSLGIGFLGSFKGLNNLGISSGNAQLLLKILKINRPRDYFKLNKNILCERKTL